jgi:hypothetical protein
VSLSTDIAFGLLVTLAAVLLVVHLRALVKSEDDQ